MSEPGAAEFPDRAPPPAPQAAAACRYEANLFGDGIGDFRRWRCPHPVERDGHCIHHLRKLAIDERRSLAANEAVAAEQLDAKCRAELAALIARSEQDSAAAAHEFIGFELPPGFGLGDGPLAKPLDFRYARFCGEAVFAMRDLVKADFRNAEFMGPAHFDYAGFHGGAQFQDARFRAVARFASAHFHGRTHFARATFVQDVHFDDASFDDFANFCAARFDARASFRGFGKPVFAGVANFCEIGLGSGAAISFTGLSLAKADFNDSDLQRVRFIGVTWNTLDGRPCLWGEVRLLKIDPDPAARREHGIADWEEPPDPAKLAECYAQLVLNYEQRRDVDTAEAFHIGEMETRRRRVASEIRQPGVRAVRERVNGFGLYRLSSVYGTSYPRAALVLGCLLLLLSLLFLWTGLAPAEPSTGPRPAAVEYRLWPDAQHRRVEAKEWLQDFTSALIFTLSIATFQKDRQYQAAGRASEFLAVATVVLVGAQAALLLFAVRRRFKR